ncbi:MAG TPA: hypothetical protein PK530_20130 [Anaerolineales bacterium]|nr:hypothetical protein [Anaerolineales bacterium]
MPWHITYHPDLAIIETCYEGRLPPNELREAVETTVSQGQSLDTQHFLGDCSNLEGGHSIIELYELADLLTTLRPYRFREAIILPQLKAVQRDIEFWETICANRGFIVRVFDTREAALAWLCSASPSDL